MQIGTSIQTGPWADYIEVENGWSRLALRVSALNTLVAAPVVSRKFGGQGGRAANAVNSAGTIEVLCFYEDFDWVRF